MSGYSSYPPEWGTGRFRDRGRRFKVRLTGLPVVGVTNAAAEAAMAEEHERMVQGESGMKDAQEITQGDVAPMPDLDPAGGNHQTEEEDEDGND